LAAIAEGAGGVHLISAILTEQARFASGRRLKLTLFARVTRRLSFLELVLTSLAVLALTLLSILSRLTATSRAIVDLADRGVAHLHYHLVAKDFHRLWTRDYH
jgi:hypothetical protein